MTPLARSLRSTRVSLAGACLAIGTLLACAGLSARARQPQHESEDALAAGLSPLELAAYHELRILMNAHQARQFLLLPSAERRLEWIERFWKQRDPTPTTDENERRAEHEQRILLARKLYPSPKAPGWDARGEAIIRFGVPSERAKRRTNVTPSSYTPAGEMWSYRVPPLILHFNMNFAGEYVYSADAASWSDKRRHAVPAEPDYIADPLLVEQMQHLSPPPWPYNFEDCSLPENWLARWLEEHRAIHTCDLNERLPLFFDFATFRNADGTTRTEVSLEVPASGVTFVPRDGARRAEVLLSVAIMDYEWKSIARSSGSIEAAIASDAMPPAALLPGQIAVSLPPGLYRAGIEASDSNAKRRAAYTTTLRVDPLDGSPAMSDIQFASAVAESGEGGRFQKGALRVVPHPLRAYRAPFPVSIYFEIYGLDVSPEGAAFYRVEYRIVPLEPKRAGPVFEEIPPAISSSFETSGFGAVQPQHLSIATDNLWEGRFRLVVTVTDRRTFRSATRAEEFSILK